MRQYSTRKLQLAAWRGVVPTRRSHLDHQPIHLAICLLQHGRGQRVGRDNGQKPGPGQRGKLTLHKVARIGHPEKLREALAQGATGVQVGTAFEFATESGLREDYKQSLLARAVAGNAEVFTDPLASPTGFPFKVARLEGTGSEPEVYAARPRICDLGFLREPYRTPEGTIGYRCAAEPLSLYLSKGGKAEDTVGRKCICNALVANIGHPQIRNGRRVEKGLVTAGDDLNNVRQFLARGRSHYSAADVIAALL